MDSYNRIKVVLVEHSKTGKCKSVLAGGEIYSGI